MKPYKGIIRIDCRRAKKDCVRNLKKDVQPSCMDCTEAITKILNLEDKPLFEYRSPPQKIGVRIKKSRSKKEAKE